MAGLDVSNNIWYTSATNWYYWNASGGNNLSTWNALVGVGTNLNSNPLMTEPISGNFSIKGTSPCRDAGTGVGLSQDYAGNSIVETPDIGAYEYQGLAKPTNLRIIAP